MSFSASSSSTKDDFAAPDTGSFGTPVPFARPSKSGSSEREGSFGGQPSKFVISVVASNINKILMGNGIHPIDSTVPKTDDGVNLDEDEDDSEVGAKIATQRRGRPKKSTPKKNSHVSSTGDDDI